METKAVYYKSDFVATIANEADWESPFEVRFWTTCPAKAKKVSFDGENYSGCSLNEEGLLLVPFDNFIRKHSQGFGLLKMEITHLSESSAYSDGVNNRVLQPETVVHQDEEGNEYYLKLGLEGDESSGIVCFLNE